MKGRPTIAFLLAGCAAVLASPLAATASETTPAREAVEADGELARAARSRLRAMGPKGLDLIIEANLPAIEAMREGLAAGAPSRPEWGRLRAAIDAVARQRDAAWSGLYWFTDFAAAKKAAADTGRPILSLRLLGNLDEELSCANSRFFRTALYANAAISGELRDHWILHWESVRPVPKITIDYGDGRKLVRTITGNSLHYVLDSNGGVIDVLPGLWAPDDFLLLIEKARETRKSTTGESTTGDFLEGKRASRQALAPVESTVAHIPFEEKAPGGEGRREIGRADVSARSGAKSVLDSRSFQLMRVKMRGADAVAFSRTIRNFEQSLAAETSVNEKLRQTIRQWLSDARAPVDLAALTNRIYDEVFLTPRSDPWLGLVVADAFNAIEGDAGAVAATARPGSPDAMAASRLALSKRIPEKPILTALVPPKK